MNVQPTRLIRLPAVIERTGYGKAWIYRLIIYNELVFKTSIGGE